MVRRAHRRGSRPTHGRTASVENVAEVLLIAKRPYAAVSILIIQLLAMAKLALSTTAEGKSTAERADMGLECIDKIDNISGSGPYTSDDGSGYGVKVTDNPSPKPDGYSLCTGRKK